MAENATYNETCIQEACFFLPFFESGEWRTKGKSPWEVVKKTRMTPDALRSLAAYTERRLSRSADLMEFLMNINDSWDVTVKKNGVYLETDAMIFEDILPMIEQAGFSEDDYVLYSEYTRKWGMI